MSLAFFTKRPDELSDEDWMYTVRLIGSDRETAAEREAWRALSDERREWLCNLYVRREAAGIFHGLPGKVGAKRHVRCFAWWPVCTKDGWFVWLGDYWREDILLQSGGGPLEWIETAKLSAHRNGLRRQGRGRFPPKSRLD